MLNNQRENIADVMLSISFTFNCMLSSYRLYIHYNYAFAAAIMHPTSQPCSSPLRRRDNAPYITTMFVSFPRPPREPSPKKTSLKFTISFLTSSILFAIVGVDGCLGLFCFYFFIEDKPLPVRKKPMKKKV